MVTPSEPSRERLAEASLSSAAAEAAEAVASSTSSTSSVSPASPSMASSTSAALASPAGGTGTSGAEVRPEMAGVWGTIELIADKCTSCMLCARECPDWCIFIDSHTEEAPPHEGGSAGARARKVHVLDAFAIDFGLCMYCGICVEVCPFDALGWSPELTDPGVGPTDLLHGIDRLDTSR